MLVSNNIAWSLMPALATAVCLFCSACLAKAPLQDINGKDPRNIATAGAEAPSFISAHAEKTLVHFPDNEIGSYTLVPISGERLTMLLRPKMTNSMPAKGTITVPAGQAPFLFANYTTAADNSEVLSSLRSDDLIGISFYKMPLDDTGVRSIRNLTSLQRLDLKYTDITDGGLSALTKLSNLVCLEIAACNIQGPGLRQLALLKKLEWLDVSKNNFTEASFAGFPPLHSLKVLCARRCHLSNPNLVNIGKLPACRMLDLQENPKITATALAQLENCKSIAILHLYKTGVTPADAKHFKVFTQLHELRIGGYGFNADTVAAWKKELPQVRVVLEDRSGDRGLPAQLFNPLH